MMVDQEPDLGRLSEVLGQDEIKVSLVVQLATVREALLKDSLNDLHRVIAEPKDPLANLRCKKAALEPSELLPAQQPVAVLIQLDVVRVHPSQIRDCEPVLGSLR
jgi:hypothetical protein